MQSICGDLPIFFHDNLLFTPPVIWHCAMHRVTGWWSKLPSPVPGTGILQLQAYSLFGRPYHIVDYLLLAVLIWEKNTAMIYEQANKQADISLTSARPRKDPVHTTGNLALHRARVTGMMVEIAFPCSWQPRMSRCTCTRQGRGRGPYRHCHEHLTGTAGWAALGEGF